MAAMRRFATVCSLLGLLLLSACAGELNTPAEALRLLGSSLDEAVLGEPYEQALRTAGGLRPYTYELTEGELPAGLELEGGVVRGTPEETGRFTFTVSLSDANLSSTFHEYRLTVIEVPPPRLELTVPGTETRREFTVTAEAVEARKLRGVSTVIRWDPERFSLVEDSAEPGRRDVIMFSTADTGSLQVDLAFTGSGYSGDSTDLFRFRLEPLQPVRPGVEAATLFVSGAAAAEHFATQRAGARVRLPAAEPSAAGEDAAAEDAAGNDTDGSER